MPVEKIPCQECGKPVASSHMDHHLKSKHSPKGESTANVQTAPDSVMDILQGVAAELKNLGKRLQQLEDRKTSPEFDEAFAISKSQPPAPTLTIETNPADEPILHYTPVNIRKMVDEILGADFKVEVLASKDLPQFEFHVIVPERYGTSFVELSGPNGRVKQPVEDRRTRIISNAEGVNGVRDWCLKVKQNLLKTMGGKLN